VGYQDDSAFYLDPHIVHQCIRPDMEFSPESFHCEIPRKLNILSMDPTLAFGFYCHDKADFQSFVSHIENLPSRDPIVTIMASRPSYVLEGDMSSNNESDEYDDTWVGDSFGDIEITEDILLV